MSYTSDLYVLYDAEQDAAIVKSMPQDLEDNKDLWGQYAYDPYEKEDQVVLTYEKVAGVTISLNKSETSILKDADETLIATVNLEEAGDPEWSSSDETVATVDDEGKITGVKAGEAVITAAVLGKSASCTVTVTE